jgi:sulfoacetaldehyde acetyltransferase
MTLPANLTALREGIPAIACVLNNQQWGSEKQNQLSFYSGRVVGGDLPENPDFAQIARDIGAHGIRVEEPDKVRPAVETALETNQPSVLDIVTNPKKWSNHSALTY